MSDDQDKTAGNPNAKDLSVAGAEDPLLPALIAGLATEVRAVNVNLLALSKRIDRRPTRNEATYRRRLTVLGIVVLILGIMQLTDLHTEACGPGHRSEAIVRSIVHGKIHTTADFNRVADRATPSDFCGLTFPTHTHDGHRWPEPQHLLGIVMYAAILSALGVWTYQPYRRTRREDDAT